MSNQQVKQHELNHPDFPDYVLVSSFLGAPVYQKRSDIIAGPTPRDSVQQAPQPELGGPVAALPHVPPVLASTAPQSPITAPAEPAGEEGLGAADVIPRPLMRFPNIAEGRAALGFTNSRWNYLYSRAQEIIVPFLDENPQTATTPLHLRAENHPDNLGRLIQEFPDLKRCEGNWGVKWVIKKARHAITVRGVSDRKWCSRSSLGDTPLESADETEKDEAEGTGDDTEDDPGASEDSRGPADNNNTASSSTESLLPAGPPTAAKVDVPAWHKYMTPQYTQGRGPSIYGLTKPIVPFFEPAAGPPSMRHATADLDSDINTNIKKRAKRLPRPEIAPPRPMAPAVIVNPGVGTANASDAPTKPLGMSASLETPARPPVAALNAPKVARHVSTPVLFARGDGVGPMQIAYASVSDLRKRKITALEPAVSNDSQYNAQAAGGYPAPYIRGHAYHSSIENMPTQAGKTTPFSVLEVRTLHRARPQWNSANNYPRFDQLTGGSNGGAVNILNTEQKPGTRALNCGTHSDIAGVNNPNGRLGGPSGGQYYQNHGQGGPRVDSQQHHGFNPNGNPYATGRVPISNVVNHGGAHPNTPNGNSNSSHNAGTTAPTTTLPSIHTLPGIHALPRLEPHHTLYSNAAANPRHAYSPNPTGSDGASTIPGRALPQPRRGGGGRTPSWGTNPF